MLNDEVRFMEFNEKLLFARAKLNLTQRQIGELLHVSMATICRWESGKVLPTKKAKVAFEQFCKDHNIVIQEDEK